jgi:hypothetical protein
MKIETRKWPVVTLTPVEMPVGLIHLESDFCWCDPLIEFDENGGQVILHRHVSWN